VTEEELQARIRQEHRLYFAQAVRLAVSRIRDGVFAGVTLTPPVLYRLGFGLNCCPVPGVTAAAWTRNLP
jgi:hypothetical protein